MDRSASGLGSASLLTHGALTHVICQDAAYALAVLPEEPAHAVHLRGSKHTPGVRGRRAAATTANECYKAD